MKIKRCNNRNLYLVLTDRDIRVGWIRYIDKSYYTVHIYTSEKLDMGEEYFAYANTWMQAKKQAKEVFDHFKLEEI